MARKPNYRFERMERDRAKAAKTAAKAAAKRRQSEDAAGSDTPVASSSEADD